MGEYMKKFLLIFIILFAVAIFFIPSYKTTSLFDTNKTSLIVEGDIIMDYPLPVIKNEQILLPLPVIEDFIDTNVYWDEAAKKIVFTTKDKVITMKTDNLSAIINQRPVELNIPAELINSIPYVPFEFLCDIFLIDMKYVSCNNVVIIDKRTNLIHLAKTIQDKSIIRKAPSQKAHILKKDIESGETMKVFEEYEKWYKVRTEEGIIGYIEKKAVKTTVELVENEEVSQKTNATWKPENGKLNLAWEHVISKNPDTSKLTKINGLDVISPTWFAIIDDKGSISNRADKKYIDWAHNNGYQVWGLFSNSFDKDLTNKVLNNTDTRQKVISQMLIYASLYKLDGINIDFENVYLKDKNILTQFIRELSPLCKEQNLILSIDVGMPSNSETWSLCYDKKALSKSVDYMCLMAYDQHWAKSPVAGSVAELQWVERGIQKTLTEVPSQKLLLGLPFYTRQWEETLIDGKTEVSSKALSMETAQKIIKEKKASIVWDDKSGQNYAEYSEGNKKYKIWLEDKYSINLRTSLIHKYDLAGSASWRRGFETPDIWVTLYDNLKVKKNYIEWAKANSLDSEILQ